MVCRRIILKMISMTTTISTQTLFTQILPTVKMIIFLVSLSDQSAIVIVYCIKPLFQHRRREAEQIL
jgi:hypothetical protein